MSQTEHDEDAQWTIDRAADMLEHYAAYIRRVHPDDIECHPYLPEVDYVAAQLRAWFSPPSSLLLDREEAEPQTADSVHLSPSTNGPESLGEAVKNAAMIRAVLDGRHLQFRSGGKWVDCGGDAQAWITLLTLNSTRDNRYRVRPRAEAGA